MNSDFFANDDWWIFEKKNIYSVLQASYCKMLHWKIAVQSTTNQYRLPNNRRCKSQFIRHSKELLNYGFCNKSFRKDEPLTSWTLLQHICSHFWAWLLLYSAITPKSEDKYVVKVFNWSEVHLSEMTLLQNPYFSSCKDAWHAENLLRVCTFLLTFLS